MDILHSFFSLLSEKFSISSHLLLATKTEDPSNFMLGMPVFDVDFYKLLYKFFINALVVVIIVRYIYYPTTKRKDYLFTYFLISFITFFICIALKNKNLDTGMALGLFAIFGIIRYRTDAIPIKEMTYLFVVIGISVINALSGKDASHISMFFINLVLLILIYGFEYIWLLKHETSKLIIYEKIDLIKPEKRAELKMDLESRTGLKINRITIGKIDFLRDTAQIFIHYFESNSESDYTSKRSDDDSDD